MKKNSKNTLKQNSKYKYFDRNHHTKLQVVTKNICSQTTHTKDFKTEPNAVKMIEQRRSCEEHAEKSSKY